MANRGELNNLKVPPDLSQSQHSPNLTAFLSRYMEFSKYLSEDEVPAPRNLQSFVPNPKISEQLGLV